MSLGNSMNSTAWAFPMDIMLFSREDMPIDYLKAEHRIAKEISGKDTPNLIIYGGGKIVQEYCAAHSLVYVEQLMTNKRDNG